MILQAQPEVIINACFLHTRLGALRVHCRFWRELQSLLQPHAHTHVCIPRLGTCIQRFHYRRGPWAETLSSCVFRDLLKGGRGQVAAWRHFSSLLSRYFPTPNLSPFLGLRFTKQEAFVWAALGSEMILRYLPSAIRSGLPNPHPGPFCCENGTLGDPALLPLGLLYCHSKWTKSWLLLSVWLIVLTGHFSNWQLRESFFLQTPIHTYY